MTCDILSIFLCLNRLPEEVPFLLVPVTEHLLSFSLFHLCFLCEGEQREASPALHFWASGSRPHLPAAVLVRGAQPRPGSQVRRAIQWGVCVQKLSSPYAFATAMLTVYRLLIGGLYELLEIISDILCYLCERSGCLAVPQMAGTPKT